METEKIVSELKDLIEKQDKFIMRNNKMIEEMEMYIAYWPKKDVKERFKTAVATFMEHNALMVAEKMECLQLLNEIEQDMYTAMYLWIMDMK